MMSLSSVFKKLLGRKKKPEDNVLVDVVHLVSPSYSGTSWINTILGSHEDAFALGPGDRFLSLWEDSPEKMCLVHGADCEFWPKFCIEYDSEDNFFVQLSKHSRKKVIVTNNLVPDGMGRHLDDPRVRVHTVYIVRNGLALAASHARHNKVEIKESIEAWVLPALEWIQGRVNSEPHIECFNYEDIANNPVNFLAQMSDLYGLRYTDTALKFWEHDQHLITSNTSIVFAIKRHLGLPSGEWAGTEFYSKALNQQQEESQPVIRDERWLDEVSESDFILFESLCGNVNGKLGYDNKSLIAGRAKSDDHELFVLMQADYEKLITAAEVDDNINMALKTLMHYSQEPVIKGYVDQFKGLVASNEKNLALTTGVDFGCWYGLSTILLSRMGARRMIGLDVVASIVEVAKAFRDVIGISSIEYKSYGDPFSGSVEGVEAGRADWAIVNDVFSFANPECFSNCLAELYRILKPGGRLYFSDANNPYHQPTVERLLSTYKSFETGEGSAKEPNGTYFNLRKDFINRSFQNIEEKDVHICALNTAYMWGKEIEQWVEQYIEGRELAGSSRFEPNELRPPIHPIDGRSIGSVTDPLRLRELMQKAGFEMSIHLDLSLNDSIESENDLKIQDRFFIIGVKS